MEVHVYSGVAPVRKRQQKNSGFSHAEDRKGGPDATEISFLFLYLLVSPPFYHFIIFAHGALALFFTMLNGSGIKIFTGMNFLFI